MKNNKVYHFAFVLKCEINSKSIRNELIHAGIFNKGISVWRHKTVDDV